MSYQKRLGVLPTSANVSSVMTKKAACSSCLMGKLVPSLIAARPDVTVMTQGALSKINPAIAFLMGSYLHSRYSDSLQTNNGGMTDSSVYNCHLAKRSQHAALVYAWGDLHRFYYLACAWTRATICSNTQQPPLLNCQNTIDLQMFLISLRLCLAHAWGSCSATLPHLRCIFCLSSR